MRRLPYRSFISLLVMFYGLVFLVLLGTISFGHHHSLGPLRNEISLQRVVIAKRMCRLIRGSIQCS
ncbi:hypothetical protein JB92DRAFT_2840570 [Gautieria morchelliformis]|nr:hypothetical protein JB92DRAFT_2840570 [Gautieria morchelliformis]